MEQPISTEVFAGGLAQFRVRAIAGGGILVYNWLVNSETLIPNNERIVGASSPNLMILNSTTNDNGQYSVLVSNEAGSTISVTVSLTVGMGCRYV